MSDFIEGSGNAFQDLGFEGLELLELTAKSALMNLLYVYFVKSKMTKEEFYRSATLGSDEGIDSFFNAEIYKFPLSLLCNMLMHLTLDGIIQQIKYPRILE